MTPFTIATCLLLLTAGRQEIRDRARIEPAQYPMPPRTPVNDEPASASAPTREAHPLLPVV